MALVCAECGGDLEPVQKRSEGKKSAGLVRCVDCEVSYWL